MNKQLPDKWIRKAIYKAINNIAVLNEVTNQTIEIPCFDTRVPTNNEKHHYVLMTSQTNNVNKANKCEYIWESSITLDVITYFIGAGNTGSRLLADNILDEIRLLTNNISLEASSGLKVFSQIQSFPNDLATITKNENIFRKFIKIDLVII
mgnify:CR=1 FL=1|jgi:hypothetical protein|tara:strand:+ start:593 stop:1045 length:453 start_codon:yes stop_codon:yes gene_type:complete